jgi:hypothetical protein
VIREDRELLAELALPERDIAFLGMFVMDGSVSAAEQQDCARRLIAARQRLQRASGMAKTVIEGAGVADGRIALPEHSVEPYWNGAAS